MRKTLLFSLLLFMSFFFLKAQNRFSYKILKESNFEMIKDAESVKEKTPVKLGFNFNFSGKNYEILTISPKGYISFESDDEINIKDL